MRPVLIALLFGVALAIANPAHGAEESNDELFQGALAALSRGAVDDAIDRFELLADRGFSHPDASYDRAIAYARRAMSRSGRPGDLGRAAAALEETLGLAPGDDEASIALERVRSEIARRRARVGATDMDQRVSLGWAVVQLLDENTWALLAAFASLVVSLGLVLRFVAGGRRKQLAGVIAASIGAAVLVVTASLAALARHDRLTTRTGIVIVDEARLLDAAGRSITGPGGVVPEGATVRVTGQKGSLAEVEWGTISGWLSLGQLRVVAKR